MNIEIALNNINGKDVPAVTSLQRRHLGRNILTCCGTLRLSCCKYLKTSENSILKFRSTQFRIP